MVCVLHIFWYLLWHIIIFLIAGILFITADREKRWHINECLLILKNIWFSQNRWRIIVSEIINLTLRINNSRWRWLIIIIIFSLSTRIRRRIRPLLLLYLFLLTLLKYVNWNIAFRLYLLLCLICNHVIYENRLAA